ncbi:hypothetical protein [Roseomonas genomospecies 6]|uniref:Uncharacterized protein n=1 Tax=Roseomonas genomospecies 6 TaxID=214106 RepID=A0A9W7NFP1_9PROT|nr:hypothetical protein [Roseomonas genomospecies 6]KAA0677674.1 hypothetical protein DS843_22815 [Roseomonas genomospecies 6]
MARRRGPKVKRTQQLEKHARLDGDADILFNLFLDGDGEERPAWIAFRATEQGAQAFTNTEHALPDVVAESGPALRSKIVALIAANPAVICDTYEQARDRYWRLQRDDRDDRDRLERLAREWTVENHIDVGGGLWVAHVSTTELIVPKPRAKPRPGKTWHFVFGRTETGDPVELYGYETREDLATRAPTAREAMRHLTHVLRDVETVSGFSDPDDARILFALLRAKLTGRPPVPIEGRPLPAFQVIEAWPLAGRKKAVLARSGDRWLTVETRPPDRYRRDAFPMAQTGWEKTFLDDETAAVGRFFARGLGMSEAKAKEELKRIRKTDRHGKLISEAICRGFALHAVAVLSDGRSALHASCAWPAERFAPDDLKRPTDLIILQEGYRAWELDEAGEHSLALLSLDPQILPSVAANGVVAASREKILDALRTVDVGFASASAADAAWEQLVSAGVVTATTTGEERASEPRGNAYLTERIAEFCAWSAEVAGVHNTGGAGNENKGDETPSPRKAGGRSLGRRKLTQADVVEGRTAPVAIENEKGGDETPAPRQAGRRRRVNQEPDHAVDGGAPVAAGNENEGDETPPRHAGGRPRIHESDAARRRAWRARKRAEAREKAKASPAAPPKHGRPRLYVDDKARKQAFLERRRAEKAALDDTE